MWKICNKCKYGAISEIDSTKTDMFRYDFLNIANYFILKKNQAMLYLKYIIKKVRLL